ncbi:Uncharacterized protein TCM_031696 [Theobroma cacao]|uniref:Ubiquitin-like protease family profile domain-containing protein n=1 Tax=Theobroma cacao TaxID=3641 RepID=A0A061F8I9_THECC|nr:Uncharacterized protein TCM_031696 [Theobroma cacao]
MNKEVHSDFSAAKAPHSPPVAVHGVFSAVHHAATPFPASAAAPSLASGVVPHVELRNWMQSMQLEIQQSMQLEIQRAMQMQMQSLHEYIQHSLQGLEDQLVGRLIDRFEGRRPPIGSPIEHHVAPIPSPVEAAQHSQLTPSLEAPPPSSKRDLIFVLCKRAREHHPQHYKQRICIVDTTFYLILLYMSQEMRPSPTKKTFKPSEVVFPDDVLAYAKGGRPPWGLPWHEVDSILVSCFFYSHWVVVHVNLLKWTMMLVYSLYSKKEALKFGLRDTQMSLLTSLFPIICHQVGYFVNSHHQKRGLIRMKYRLNENTLIQQASHSYGDWVIASLQWLIGSEDQKLKANAIEGIRTKFALEIFANSSNC